jgi:Uma2 family endonuclease
MSLLSTTETLILAGLENLSDADFAHFCTQNRELRIERYSPNDIRIMSPTFFLSSRLNNEIARQLGNWYHATRTGYVGESNAGYQLAPKVMLSPDASWISEARIAGLTRTQREDEFLPACPDFVVELKSKTDRLATLKQKMTLWLKYGVRLGWLLDPATETVYVYRAGRTTPTVVHGYGEPLSGEPELPGFALELAELRREMAR